MVTGKDMKSSNHKIRLYLVVGILGALTVSGCVQSKTVPEDATNWKGGSMPKDFDPRVPAPTPAGVR